MRDELPPEKEDDSLDDLHTVRGLWPLVQQHDGSDFTSWGLAWALHKVARQTIQRRYFQLESGTPAEEQELLALLEDLGENLTRNDGIARPLAAGDWQRVLAQLSRVLPLVERLLQ